VDATRRKDAARGHILMPQGDTGNGLDPPDPPGAGDPDTALAYLYG
jgi:hypothetical protein